MRRSGKRKKRRSNGPLALDNYEVCQDNETEDEDETDTEDKDQGKEITEE